MYSEIEADRKASKRKAKKAKATKRSKKRSKRYASYDDTASETDSEEERRQLARRKEKEKERERERERRKRYSDDESSKDKRRKKRKSEDGHRIDDEAVDQWVEKDGEVVLAPKPEDRARLVEPPPIMYEEDSEDDEVGPHLPVEHGGRERIDRTA